MKRGYGKVFKNQSVFEYGVIRKSEKPSPTELANRTVLNEDESGNYFIDLNKAVYPWDHETGEDELFAKSLGQFISDCSGPAVVDLKPDQVESARIEPELAKNSASNPIPKEAL